MEENYLNDTSFESGLFANTKRPLYIYLRDKKVFGVFLRNDKKNVINLDTKQIVCDCRMFWLMKGRKHFSKRVINVIIMGSISGN